MSKKFTNVNIAQRIAQQQQDQQKRSQTAVVIPKQSTTAAAARIAILKVPKAKKEGKADGQPTPISQPSAWTTKGEGAKDTAEVSEKRGAEEPNWGDESGEMDFTEALPGMGDNAPKGDSAEIQLRPQRPMQHPQQPKAAPGAPPVTLLRRPQQPPQAAHAPQPIAPLPVEEPVDRDALQPPTEAPAQREVQTVDPEPRHAQHPKESAPAIEPAGQTSPPADKSPVVDALQAVPAGPPEPALPPALATEEPTPAEAASPEAPPPDHAAGGLADNAPATEQPLGSSPAPSPEPTPDLQSVPVPEQPPALLPGGAQMSLPLPQFEPAPQADASDNASSNELGSNSTATDGLAANGSSRPRPKPYMPPKGGGLLGTMPPTGDLVSTIPYFSAQNVALLRQLQVDSPPPFTQPGYGEMELPEENAAFNSNLAFALDLTGDGRARASPLAGADLLTNMLNNAQNGGSGTADAPSPFRVVLRPARSTVQQPSQSSANGKQKGGQQGLSGPPSSSPTSGDSNSWDNQSKDKQPAPAAASSLYTAAGQPGRPNPGKGDGTRMAWNEPRGRENGPAAAPGGRAKRALWDEEDNSQWAGPGKPSSAKDRGDDRWRQPLFADPADAGRHPPGPGERDRWGARSGAEKQRSHTDRPRNDEPPPADPKAGRKEETWASRRWASRKEGAGRRPDDPHARPERRERDGERRRGEEEGEAAVLRGKGQRGGWEGEDRPRGHRDDGLPTTGGRGAKNRHGDSEGGPKRPPDEGQPKGPGRDRGQGKGKGRGEGRPKAPTACHDVEAADPAAEAEAGTQKKPPQQRRSRGGRSKRDAAQAVPVDRQSAARPADGSDDAEEAAPGRRPRARPQREEGVADGGEQTEGRPAERRPEPARRRGKEVSRIGEGNAADGEAIQAEGDKPERPNPRRDRRRRPPKAEGVEGATSPDAGDADAAPDGGGGAANAGRKPRHRRREHGGARRADPPTSGAAAGAVAPGEVPAQLAPPPAPDRAPPVAMDAG